MDINSYLVPGKRVHLAGIGGVERRDESTVVRTVTFETMTTLTGD